jgi:hypothetical protein
MKVLPAAPQATSTHMFDEIVCLRFETGWVYIESGKQALDCLTDHFKDHAEPSWQRAHSTCSAFVAGQAGAEAAKSTLIVAAMAAGIAFEVAKGFEVVERHVEEAATEGLVSTLFNDESTD